MALTFFTLPLQASDERPSILILGDSLSAGFGLDIEESWVSLLQTRLDKEGYGYKVVNASISGDTTGNGLRRLPRALQIHQPEIVIIELGGNDGLRGISIDIMRNNLEEMINLVQEGQAEIVLAGMLIPPNYGADYTQSFADVYPELAKKYGLALIPFFMEGVALEANMMQPDGIHPNKKAQPVLMETVWVSLKPELKEPVG
ncbi:MAG: arylesterase [Gammaproteobacteria bacterium]